MDDENTDKIHKDKSIINKYMNKIYDLDDGT